MDITDPSSLDAIPVEHLFDLAADFDPMKVYPSPFGMRVDAIVRQGKVQGPRLQGELVAGGGDWIVVGGDGVARLDIRDTIRTPDDEMIFFTGTGRVVVDEGTRDRFLAGETITFAEMYGRTAPLFETSSEAYAWLNRTVAVGLVAELSLQHIRYHVYRLS